MNLIEGPELQVYCNLEEECATDFCGLVVGCAAIPDVGEAKGVECFGVM